ncbi:hypothetical protein I4I73_09920 [Pseudonocardia sp. KRD-184]|uniref:Uncharacterized protein n=1 Tax=Pseudonocardia oceani TaxID=2792013 RepID=A0ABS6U2F4_9PSEU|nr:hypothetical protein [Pseudonocardia oceani]MBW0088127.1 hypothetical protein [Pseudonocardia oceani]MBW0096301.1 hypothetical protein [Pseudonocardia oceani]MBW0107157.1 hypothetical protein [Pseudonocardia oceani]MBW0119747.1 hypothetical protein [Pseudonocardia oceani]MBW0126410.1 hypothetical protein [Pseudonocardia oceani]
MTATDPLLARGSGGWRVQVVRPDPKVALFEVALSDYREFFFVAVGERSVSVTMYDTSDQTYPEPQTFTFAKPYGWDADLGDEEALLQVWQAVGVQR